MDSSRFLRLWPTNRHFLILILTVIAIIASHSSVLLFNLRPSYTYYSSHTSIYKRNLFVICVTAFHVPHPYNSTDLTLILNIRIIFIGVFLFWHNVCSSTKFPFALLIRAWKYWSAPPSAVTALPTHVDCSTLSITTLFVFTFVIIFEFICSSFVLFDCSRKIKPKFQFHMDFSTLTCISLPWGYSSFILCVRNANCYSTGYAMISLLDINS
jgi:hypothetical protein